MIPWWQTSFNQDEVQRLAKAVSAGCISQGTVTQQFEAQMAERLDVPYAVATTSGSVALLMALMALGIGKGDEVIVPDRTWVATAHAVLLAGAGVVLVDVLPDIPVLDVSQLESHITSRTKAIIPVHLNGRAADMDAIRNIAEEHGLLVIEDACQALLSRNDTGFLGTQSDAGCFSLGVTKLISTGQGGTVVTRSRETYEKLKLVRNHGVVDQFTDSWSQVGFNFKFTDLLASFGLVQLSRANERMQHVRALYSRYEEVLLEFPFLRMVPVDAANGELPLYVEVLCDQREPFMAFLNSKGIQTRPVPPSLHTSQYLESPGDFPNSARFGKHQVYLPCGPTQPLENVARVVDAMRLYAGRANTPYVYKFSADPEEMKI